MPTFRTQPLAELARQMAFTPPDRRREQIANAELLYWQLDPDRTYPLDFLIFRITRYRGDETDRPTMLVGQAVRADLLLLVEQVSDTLDDPPTRYTPPPLDLRQLCDRLSVTPRTVARYRKTGLFARRLVYPMKRRPTKKLAFLVDSVERFEADQRPRLDAAERFDRISDDDRHRILLRARRIAGRTDATLYTVARHLARRSGRSVEAIRRLIVEHDRHDRRFAIFPDRGEPLDATDQRAIADRYGAGESVAKLAAEFGKTRDAIYRSINKRRGRALRRRRLHFVVSPTFELPNAESVILNTDIGHEPAADADAEQALFVRYNYCKYRAARIRQSLDRYRPGAAELDRAETMLRYADQLEQRLCDAYRPVVDATARRHLSGREAGAGPSREALVAEGEKVLHRSVEAFDPTRGARFEPFVTYALMRHFARGDAPSTSEARPSATPGDAIEALLDVLEPDERRVIVQHLGLSGEPPVTLAQIGEAMGLPPERARQTEKRATKKLRAEAAEAGITIEQLLPDLR